STTKQEDQAVEEEISPQLLAFVHRARRLQEDLDAASAEPIEPDKLPKLFNAGGTPQSLSRRYDAAVNLLRVVIHLLEGRNPEPQDFFEVKLKSALKPFNLRVVKGRSK